MLVSLTRRRAPDEIGTLIVVDEKIAAIGKNIDAPANMQTLDRGGKALIPA